MYGDFILYEAEGKIAKRANETAEECAMQFANTIHAEGIRDQ